MRVTPQHEQYGLPHEREASLPSASEMADLLSGPRIMPGLMKRAEMRPEVEDAHRRVLEQHAEALDMMGREIDPRGWGDKEWEEHRKHGAEYHGEGDVQDKSGPFAGPHGTFPVGTPKDLHDAKDVCNMPSVRAKHPGTCESIEKRGNYDEDDSQECRHCGDRVYTLSGRDMCDGCEEEADHAGTHGYAPHPRPLHHD
jgi:hypothetical protein